MMKKSTVSLSLVALLAGGASSACSARYLRSTGPNPAIASKPAATLTEHVILVSIDGLRPDAIRRFGAVNLQRLMRDGSYTLAATTILPSKTLPSHTSMLTGEPPERHQVFWNTVATQKRDEIELPNIFSAARSSGYETAAFFSKSKFNALQRDGTLDYSQAPGGWFGRWSGSRTIKDVEKHLATSRPNLLFVHLSDPDAAGHRSGWMSSEYARGVRAADSAVGRLLAAAEKSYGAGNYSIIVTADHGGHGLNHGSDSPEDVTIPWIAWGRGVKAGALAPTLVRTMDTASTVLWLLGVAEPADWAGSPVTNAFQTPPPAPSPTSGSR
jgi:predicted AlkP superfamily pyrophosphatase or phosphodiesterase